MGFLDHPFDRRKIEAGDHIYTWTASNNYSYHGIYVGENQVVHFTLQENNGSGSGSRLGCGSRSGSGSVSRLGSGYGSRLVSGSRSGYGNQSSNLSHSATCSSIFGCGSHKPGGGVILSCLNCFIGNAPLYLFRYEVSKTVFLIEYYGGTCTTAKSDPPEEVINRAKYLLQKGFGSFDLLHNNCQDFALYCKTGLMIRGNPLTGKNGHVKMILNHPRKAVPSISWIKKFANGPMGIVGPARSLPEQGLNRYKSDIGVRDDVVKVKVEDGALFRESNTQVVNRVP